MKKEKFDFLVFIDDDIPTNKYHEIVLRRSKLCEAYQFFDSPVDALMFFKEQATQENPKIPDYIFLDINMPEMDGWEFLEKYSTIKGEKTPIIIMLTTSLSSKDKEKAIVNNLVHSLKNKPLTKALLSEMLVEGC